MSDAFEVGGDIRVFADYGMPNVPAGWRASIIAVRDDEIDVRVTDSFFPGLANSELTFALADFRSTESGSQFFFRRVHEAEMKARRDVALAMLKERCIVVESGSCFSVDQIEAMAEFVKGMSVNGER
jgi:hypothetical protein